MLFSKKYKKIIYIIFFFLVIISFFSFFHFTFNLDEEYSVGLIEHNFKNLININMLDVHPPTYYILLKFFLYLTTFWTNSLFIKVIFSRIFSLLFYVMAFYILHKLLNLTKLNISWKLQLIFYSVIPVIGYYSTDIRMYEIYTLFNILMYYELILFDHKQKYRYLILSVIFSILSAYTDYFSAVCSGVFLIIFFVEYLWKRKIRLALDIFYSGVFLLLACIPLILEVFKQASLRMKFPSNPITLPLIMDSFTQMNNTNLLRLIIVCAFLLIPIFYSFVYMRYMKEFNHRFLEVLLNYFITTVLAIILCNKIHVYEPKFTYPQFAIYSFFIISIIIIMIKSTSTESNILQKFMCIFSISIIFILPIARIYSNYNEFDVTSFQLKRFVDNNIYNNKNKSNIYLDFRSIPKNSMTDKYQGKSLYITQISVYLKQYKKNLVLTNYGCHNINKLSHDIVNKNINLFKSNFNNLKFKH